MSTDAYKLRSDEFSYSVFYLWANVRKNIRIKLPKISLEYWNIALSSPPVLEVGLTYIQYVHIDLIKPQEGILGICGNLFISGVRCNKHPSLLVPLSILVK